MTCPLLRPDAPHPGSAASTTATSTPASRRCSAVESPVNPAPITTTSAVTGPCTSGREGLGGVTAAQSALPLDPMTGSVQLAVGGAYRAVLLSPEARAKAGFTRFSDVIVFTLFTTFLLPLLAWKKFKLPLRDVFLAHRDGLEPEDLYRMTGPLERWTPPLLGLVTMPTRLGAKHDQDDQSIYQPKLRNDAEQARYILRCSSGK